MAWKNAFVFDLYLEIDISEFQVRKKNNWNTF